MDNKVCIRLLLKNNSSFDTSRLMDDVKEIFHKYLKDRITAISGYNYQFTFFDLSKMIVSILNIDTIKSIVSRIIEEYSKQEINESQMMMLEKIKSTNNIIYFEYELELNENGFDANESRTMSILGLIFELAKKWDALVVYNDMRVYSANRQLLLSLKEGNKSHFEEYIVDFKINGNQEQNSGYSDIENVLSKVYSNDDLKQSIVPLIKYRFGGPDPLDEIRIYEKKWLLSFYNFWIK